jgi:hypothetical protein
VLDGCHREPASPDAIPLLIKSDLFRSDTVYHFCEGHDATSHASFGEAAHIAVTLHMHEEASYEGLDPIETEVRRRVFWLLFGGTSVSELSCVFQS